jgi:sec-independent protein translocase protein TatA
MYLPFMGDAIGTIRGGIDMSGVELIQANMFAPQDLMVILIIALVLFGGKKLPEIGSSLGKAIREFKHATEEWQRPVEAEHHPAPPPALTTQTAPPTGKAAGIERADEAMKEASETLDPGTRV